jgi:competence protein CoiA
MLVALNSSNNRRPAFEAEKSEKPFICPFCKREVVLKKGKVREHHYAHSPKSKCEYRKGESQLHYKVKREIYQDLKNRSNCKKCELERVLKGVRPDISLTINNYYVAIEVQKSNISIEEINERFKRYSILGIYLLWVLPDNGPKIFFHEEENVCRIKKWEKHLQTIQNGRIYFWQNGATVKPFHLGSFYTYREEREWPGEYGELNYAAGDWVEKKMLKKPIEYPSSPIHIALDFTPKIRARKRKEKRKIPNDLKLWVDHKNEWWGKYYEDLHSIIFDISLTADDLKTPVPPSK